MRFGPPMRAATVLETVTEGRRHGASPAKDENENESKETTRRDKS